MTSRFSFALAAMVAAVAPAWGLDIQFNEIATLTTAQRNAFTAAATSWENTYNDPIIVKVNIGFDTLASNILGSTQTARTTHNFNNVRTAMFNDALFTNEKNAVNMLPGLNVPVMDINGTRSDNKVTLATANAKALGLGTGLDPIYGPPLAGSADGQILFNTLFAGSFDYDPSDGVGGGLTDFTSVAKHEIGHALGFFSVTDVQDNNPTFGLHPNTLDLWRFDETGGAHAIGSENRRIVRGPAEYYDSVLNNVQFSRGQFDTVNDPFCGTSSGKCQASHWRDNLGNLMDPTLAPGVSVNIQSNDRHALDYVGYSRSLIFWIPRRYLVAWFPLPFPDDPPFIPSFNGAFDDFAEPPDPRDIKAPFTPDFAARVGMDLAAPNMENRSAVAFVQFEDEQNNPSDDLVEGISDDDFDGEQNLEPARMRFPILPPRLTDFYMESDNKGVPFTAWAAFSDLGAHYDPNLGGQFGGYHIPLFMDGMGDGVEGDVDGQMSIKLLADAGMVPNPDAMNLFELKLGGLGSSFLAFDPGAFGIPEPASLSVLAVLGLFGLRRNRSAAGS